MKCVTDERRAPPRLASKNWDEYSGKQKLLSSFFGKGGPKATDVTASSKPVDLSLLATTKTSSQSGVGAPSEPTTLDADAQSKSESAAPSQRAPASTVISISASETDPTTATSSSITSSQSSSSAKTPLKRKSQAMSNSGGSDAYDAVIPKKSKGKAATPAKDKGKEKAAQKSIATFFGKPPPTKSGGQPTPKEIVVVDDSDGDSHQDLDADFQLALKLLQEEASGLPASQNTLASSRAVDPAETKAAWSSMFAKVEPPRCTVHDEPAKEFTVNKTGPNKGKTFFVCARLVLPYDSSASLTPSLQTSRSRL
jgi:AP endonuclease-2